jgi:MYXO-CTERM domain-containing protein
VIGFLYAKEPTMKRLILALFVLSGCHGTTAYVGGGKLWQDQSATYGGGCGARGRVDTDDSYFAGAGLAVQLTPESVVHLDPSPSPVSKERLYPYEPAPVDPDPVLVELRESFRTANEKLDKLGVVVSDLTTRLTVLEDKALSYSDLVKPVGGIGGLGLLGFGGVRAYRRRRQAPIED